MGAASEEGLVVRGREMCLWDAWSVAARRGERWDGGGVAFADWGVGGSVVVDLAGGAWAGFRGGVMGSE